MKSSKLTLALFSAGILITGHAFAADSVVGTEGTIYSTFVNKDDDGNSVSTVKVVTGATTARIYEGEAATATPTSTAVQTLTPGGGSSGRTGTTTSNYSYAAGSYNSGSNTKNVAFGTGAVAGYGIQENPDFEAGTGNGYQYYGGGSSTAIGVDSLALIGGTAIGNESAATGRDSVAIGKEAVASGYKSIAVGEDVVTSGHFGTGVGNGAEVTGYAASAFGVGSIASGENSTALGAGAEATGSNAVALGSGSVASRNNTVSVGSAGAERTISNVADGIYATDAVNLRQLENVEKKLSSGIAAAMAFTVPQFAPGKSNAIAMGAAHYNGASAMSLNLAHKFTEEIIGTAGVAKGFNSASTSRGSSDDIGIKASVSWSF